MQQPQKAHPLDGRELTRLSFQQWKEKLASSLCMEEIVSLLHVGFEYEKTGEAHARELLVLYFSYAHKWKLGRGKSLEELEYLSGSAQEARKRFVANKAFLELARFIKEKSHLGIWAWFLSEKTVLEEFLGFFGDKENIPRHYEDARNVHVIDFLQKICKLLWNDAAGSVEATVLLGFAEHFTRERMSLWRSKQIQVIDLMFLLNMTISPLDHWNASARRHLTTIVVQNLSDNPIFVSGRVRLMEAGLAEAVRRGSAPAKILVLISAVRKAQARFKRDCREERRKKKQEERGKTVS